MIKVVRIPLISSTMYTDGSEVPYKDICKILWTLQNQTRTIKNKTVQLLWEWNNFSSDYKKEHGEYPKEKDILNYSFGGFAYDRLKHESDMNTANLACTLREVQKQFKAHLKDYIKGDRSILEYKSNQPLELHDKAIKLDYENKRFIFRLGLCNKDFAKQNNISTQLTFTALVKDKSQRTILERCYDGEYKISASRLIYDKKKKIKWCINLCYSFENTNLPTLDKDKILGVDLGVAKPIVASVYGEYDRLMIDGGEIEHIRNKTEKRKKSLLKASTMRGDGRKGHGYKTRVKPVLDIGDKIARCRDTINHKYSRALIDYAVKNGCGTIQMEDLKGVTKKANRFLQNWSYFDLQTKIEYKAKEQGISVIYINPHYTSQRCSKCGFIHEDNRPEQARFKCQNCGFEENADYNASQNIAVRDIDKIISANMKQT